MSEQRLRDPIAEYYESKAREARELGEALRLAILRNAPPEEIRRLERLLEMARYVGD